MHTKAWGKLARDAVGGDLRDSVAATFLAGILAHGVALFNKLSWHDDLDHFYSLSSTRALTLGRWLRDALAKGVAKAFGGKNMSLPLLYGVVSLLLIALSAHIILRTLGIRRRPLRIALCGLMVSIPVVTGTFGYMFTAPYYFLALLLAATGAYVARERGGWDGFAVAVACVCASLGLYQAYFSVAVSLLVIGLILEIAGDEYATLGQAIRRGLYDLGICVAALALYFVIWKLALKLTGLKPTDYQGASTIGQSGLKDYLRAILRAYKRFLLPGRRGVEDLYPMGIGWVQRAIIGLGGVCGLSVALGYFRRRKLLGLLMAALMALLPLCFNLIYVMSASSPDASIHTLMLYGQCMLYVFLAGMLEFMLRDGKRLAAACYRAAVAAMLLMVCMNAYYDNGCYLKAEMTIQQTASDLTVLVSRIKSTEGYSDKLPVCFVMTGEQDATLASNDWFEDLKILPFNKLSSYHYPRNLYNSLEHWCGFAPEYVDGTQFMDREEVRRMPDYPDAGSIRIIDGTVVVKG